MRLPFKLPGMDLDPRRAALLSALKAQESAPMPTPAMRQMETPESTMGPLSVEDILAERRGPTPWDEPQDGMEVMPSDDYMLERPLGQSGADPYVRENAMEDYSDPSYAPDMGQNFEEPTPQPGTPEFYEWLMRKVG